MDTLKKTKLFLSLEKEENWLNEMAQKGLVLTKRNALSYVFTKTNKKDVVIRLDYQTFEKEQEFLEYVTLFEDCGWKLIDGNKNLRYQYFIKNSSDAKEDIFSDNLSKANRSKKLFEFYSLMTLFFLYYTVMSVTKDGSLLRNINNPRNVFFTPGLWQQTGLGFWSAFFKELPFVLLRNIQPFFLVLFAFQTYKEWRSYKRLIAS